MTDFHRLPGTTPQRDTNLQADEIVTAVELPAQGFAKNYTYLKIRDRLSYAFALVSVAAAMELDGDTIKEARLALGGVAHKPWRDPSAEAALRGKTADRAAFAQAADIILRDAKGFAHNAFKIDLARRVIVRALDASGESHAAVAVQQEDPVTVMPLHSVLYRHAHLPRRRPCQSHRRREICRRIQHARAGLWRRRHLDDRQGPHRAHRRKRRRCASKACSTSSPTSTGRAWPANRKPTRTTSGRKTARRFVRSTMTRSCSAVSRSRWSWPRNGKSPASPPRWCASNTQKQKSVTDLQAERDKAFAVKKPEKPRGKADKAYAARRRAPRGGLFHSERVSTIRWNCTPRPRSGKAAASSRSTTRPRACRTCSTICAACSRIKPDDVRVMSPFMGGGFGSGLRPQYQVALAVLAARALRALGAAGSDPAADVWARLSPGHDRASCARRETRRHARRGHPRGHRGHLAIRRFLPQRHRLVGPALQKPECQIRAQTGAARSADTLRHARARARRPASMDWNARWTSLRSR